MRRPRASRAFERLGEFRPESLGLSARRARELELIAAWHRVAGKTLSALARPTRVRRGVLELESLGADEDQRRALESSLPELLAGMAAAIRKPRIQRIRILEPTRERPALKKRAEAPARRERGS